MMNVTGTSPDRIWRGVGVDEFQGDDEPSRDARETPDAA